MQSKTVTADEADFDIRDNAQLCAVVHNKLVEALMAMVDFIDLAQRERVTLDVPMLRKQTGKIIRASISDHSLGLAGIAHEAGFLEYAGQLLERAETWHVEQPDDEEGGA